MIVSREVAMAADTAGVLARVLADVPACNIDATGSPAIWTQLDRGLALQAAGRHAEALKCFEAAQQSTPASAAPFLHAAMSLLALGRADDAVCAASEACQRAPSEPQAHYVYGEAWLALGELVRAERAFVNAIRLQPAWSAAWLNYRIARERQGKIEQM
jgi:tetratricopeptide (TPR) repeat protein